MFLLLHFVEFQMECHFRFNSPSLWNFVYCECARTSYVGLELMCFVTVLQGTTDSKVML